MKFHTRLKVVDGDVFCPHICNWKSVTECARCAELTRIEQDEAGTTVFCVPEIDQPRDDLLTDMVRG